MVSLNRFFKDTLDACPFAPRSKMIGEELAGSFIKGGVDLVGNLLGFGSSMSANKTNMKIAQMNNQAQMDMLRSQQVYNEQMWNKQNDYNLPQNQVKRLLDAGINPAAVFGNGQVSEAGSLTAPQLPSLQQAHVNPFTPDFSGLGSAVDSYFDHITKMESARSIGLDNEAKRTELKYQVSRLLLDMRERVQNINESLSRQHLNEQQRDNLISEKHDLENRISYFENNVETFNEREKKTNQLMDYQSQNLIADTALKRANSRVQNLIADYYPAITQMELNQMSANIGNIIEDTQNKIRDGRIKDKTAAAMQMQNEIQEMLNKNEKFRQNVRNNNKFTRSMFTALDLISDSMFKGLKLMK